MIRGENLSEYQMIFENFSARELYICHELLHKISTKVTSDKVQKEKKNTVIPRRFRAKIAIQDFISALHFGGAYQRFFSLTDTPNAWCLWC